jgi:tRNA(fMet)-specific endonuclease VapC
MPLSLLDTDTLSEFLKKKDAVVTRRAGAYLQIHQKFIISAVTRYEIIRGLKAKYASKQLQQFATFCQHANIMPVTDTIFDRAADLWVSANAAGQPKKDADLLIAATALEHALVLVSGNTADFSWIAGLTVDNWRLT